MPWADVVGVYSEKVSRITYEENVLVFESSFGDWLAAGQLDEGFKAFEQEVRRRYPMIPANWMEPLEMGPIGDRHVHWRKSEGLTPS